MRTLIALNCYSSLLIGLKLGPCEHYFFVVVAVCVDVVVELASVVVLVAC